MKTFDDLEVKRPALAASYLGLLQAQPGRPIALFAPRRVGKTYFLDRDLTPAAQKAGLLPVYADLWLHKAAPLESINHALEEALDDVNVPKTSTGKLARTAVRKIGGLSASLEFGDEPKRRSLPGQPELRLDALVARLATDSGKCVLLMLDEIQALAASSSGEAAVATLRAVLQKRKHQVRAVFTGSSQESLSEMMIAAGGPMYQFAQLLNFPSLGDEYLELLAAHFRHVHREKKLDLEALRRVFAQIGFKPALMKDIVKEMSAEGITNVDLALERFMNDDRQVAGWQAVLARLQPIERAVLMALANGMAPMGRETIEALARIKGLEVTMSKVRTALERMRKGGILSKAANGGYVMEDRLFAAYIARAHVAEFQTRGHVTKPISR